MALKKKYIFFCMNSESISKRFHAFNRVVPKWSFLSLYFIDHCFFGYIY